MQFVVNDGRDGEREVKSTIEKELRLKVHDANIVLLENCPNIDLVVYGLERACYIQVKTSTNPAGKDTVVIDGSAFTAEQLQGNAPIFNRHKTFARA